MTTVRIGVCSWADEGMTKHWYPPRRPRGRRAARVLRRPLRRRRGRLAVLPPALAEMAAKWAERTPAGFVFHVKASGEMTGHREAEREPAFREFRDALAPLERSGKLRGVLLQYHPRVVKSREALDELVAARDLLDPLVPLDRVPPPLVARGGRARRHARVPRAARPRVRLGRRAAHARLERRPADRRRDARRRLRPLPRPQLEDVEHPRREDVGRALRLALLGGRARASGSSRSRRSPARPRRSTRCSTTTATTTRRRARRCCGGCSTRRASPPSGGIEPAVQASYSSTR